MPAFGTPLVLNTWDTTAGKNRWRRQAANDTSAANALAMKQVRVGQIHLASGGGGTPVVNAAGTQVANFDNAGAHSFGVASEMCLFSGDLRVAGNLVVEGTRTINLATAVSFSDNHLTLNTGYTTAAAQTGGVVVNYLPTGTATTANGAIVAGVASTSNPTIVTAGSATFSAGDIIQVSGSENNGENDGIYEVHTHIGTALTIRGIGTTGAVEDFTGNQLVANAADTAAAITKVAVAVLRAGSDGVWETGAGSTTGISFTDVSSSDNAGTSAASFQVNSGVANADTDNVSLRLTAGRGSGSSTIQEWRALLDYDAAGSAGAMTGDLIISYAADNSGGFTEFLRFDSANSTIDAALNINAAGGLDVTGAALTSAAGATFSAGEVLVSGGNVQLNDNINLSLGSDDDIVIDFDSGSAKLSIAGAAGASTVAGSGMSAVFGAGGAASAGGNIAGGGGAITLTSGAGGAGNTANAGSAAASGGAVSISGGAGGAGASGTNNINGASGAGVTLTGGAGGAGSGDSTGGGGGGLTLNGGGGGAAASLAGGAGGAVTVAAGSGATGNGAANGASGGSLQLNAGSGGFANGSGSAGAAGTISLGTAACSAMTINNASSTTTAAGLWDFNKTGGSTGAADFDVAGYAKFAGTVEFDAAIDIGAGATIVGGLTITSGGIDLNSGGFDLNAGGITNAGAVSGVTTLAIGGALTGVTTAAISSTATFSGAVAIAGASAIVSAGYLKVNDDIQIRLGSGDDVDLDWNSAGSFLDFNVAGAVQFDASGAIALESSGGAISIGADAVAQAINIGTGAAARAISIGASNGAGSIALQAPVKRGKALSLGVAVGGSDLDVATNSVPSGSAVRFSANDTLHICTGRSEDNNADALIGFYDGNSIVDSGPCTVVKKSGTAWAAGDVVYLDDNATSQLHTTAPSGSDDWVRPCGRAMTAATSGAVVGRVWVSLAEDPQQLA